MPQKLKSSYTAASSQSPSGLDSHAMTDTAESYTDLADEILLAKIADSDRRALEALYDRYGRRVFAVR